MGTIIGKIETALCRAPFLTLNLANAPEEHLRRLFEIVQLAVRLVDDSDEVKIEARLPAHDLPHIADQAVRTIQSMPSAQEVPAQRVYGAPVDAVRVSSGARTAFRT
ncbi:hypothetical protein [Amycolatopsis sp. SB7-3]|uniref:hypothetical protein n=1 Tax=Amycolatopsis sp. SB7-3 TaxID=3373438 RepID=UPI0037440B1E